MVVWLALVVISIVLGTIGLALLRLQHRSVAAADLRLLDASIEIVTQGKGSWWGEEILERVFGPEAVLGIQAFDSGEKGDTADLSGLRYFPEIETISLGKGYTDDDLAFLDNCRNLRSLSLYHNKVSGSGLNYLPAPSRMEHLALCFVPVTNDAGIPIARMTNLVSLNLTGTKMSDDGLARIAGLRRLKRLGLISTPTTDRGIAYFKGHPSLEEFCLGETLVTDDCTITIRSISQLRLLWLNDNAISDRALSNLGNSTVLKELRVSNTRVGDPGMVYVGRWKDIEHLELENTDVTDVGIQHLQGLTKLEWLFLEGCAVSDASVPFLLQLKRLTALDIDYTRFTKGGLTQLRAGLPRLDWLDPDFEYMLEHARPDGGANSN